MKAIVRDTYGSSDLLELRDIDEPRIGDEEVLVHVHAAGVGRDVWHVMTGLPYPIRLAGYGLRAPKNPVIGSDMAGGAGGGRNDMRGSSPRGGGFCLRQGGHRQLRRAPQGKVAPKIATLTL